MSPYAIYLCQNCRLKAGKWRKWRKKRIFWKKVAGKFVDSKNSRTFATLSETNGCLAQLVQSICLTSRGSAVRIRQRPHRNIIVNFPPIGRLAQLVQSICLTSRGSAVRIRQRPLQASQFCGAFFFLILFLYANINSGR